MLRRSLPVWTGVAPRSVITHAARRDIASDWTIGELSNRRAHSGSSGPPRRPSRFGEMPGDLRLSPSLTPSKVYHDPDRSSARKKAPPGTHARRQLDLGEDAKNNNARGRRVAGDDARRVRVPGPPRGRVFDQGPERPGSDDPPWARRLRLKLRDVRAMADEDIDDDDDDDDEPISAAMGAEGDGPTSRRAPTMRLRGNLEDILALYEPGNEKPEGFEVSITSPRSAVACLKAKCDPNSLVPRPEPVFAPQNQKNVCARRRKEQRARLTALLARRDAMDDPREVARMARELSGAAQAEAKFKEKENERQRRRDDVDERVLAALAKAELEAATLMDDLNDIASAADHEELARFGEAARERERIAAKDAARSRNLYGGHLPGFSDVDGSWKIVAILRPRIWRISDSDWLRMSIPSNVMLPLVTCADLGNSRKTDSPVTDLPQPVSPTAPKISPGCKANETPLSALRRPCCVSNSRCRSSICSNGSLIDTASDPEYRAVRRPVD